MEHTAAVAVNGSVATDNGTVVVGGGGGGGVVVVVGGGGGRVVGGGGGDGGGGNWSSAVTPTEFTPVLSPFESWQKVIIVLVIGVCMVLTITGNILVLVSFIVDRTIRQPSNYFIASLAATDMLIGEITIFITSPAFTT